MNVPFSVLKENIVELSDSEALGYLERMRPVKYNRKDQPARQHIGFIAEETPPPLSVDNKGVTIPGIVATLARVVQSQQQTIQQLTTRIGTLEQRVPQVP